MREHSQPVGMGFLGTLPVFEKTCATAQKRKKSCFLIFKKNVKNVKKRDHLVMQPLITQLPEIGTGKSRSPTSNILLRSVDTSNYMQLRTVCDKCL